MIPVSSIVPRLRTKADVAQLGKDSISQDGTFYVVPLSNKPIISGTDSVYLQHTTFTTGLPQFVYRFGTTTYPYASGNHLEYTIDYTRGELRFYQGSGTIITNTGLLPFAPWTTSTVIAYYEYSKYSDSLLSDYVSYAVAGVETALQIGMYVSGVSGIAPYPTRPVTDNIGYFSNSPYGTGEKFIIAEDVEILQETIAQKAAWDLALRERRLGAGGAIRLRDGDTEIDTSVNQKYFADFVKDLELTYIRTIKYIQHYMLEGFSLKQIDELPSSLMSSTRSSPYIEGYGTDF